MTTIARKHTRTAMAPTVAAAKATARAAATFCFAQTERVCNIINVKPLLVELKQLKLSVPSISKDVPG